MQWVNEQGGAGLASAKLLPGSRIVRAFNAISYRKLADAAHRPGGPVGVPIAGDDQQAIALAEGIIRTIGFEPVLVGGLARANTCSPARRWPRSTRPRRFEDRRRAASDGVPTSDRARHTCALEDGLVDAARCDAIADRVPRRDSSAREIASVERLPIDRTTVSTPSMRRWAPVNAWRRRRSSPRRRPVPCAASASRPCGTGA